MKKKNEITDFNMMIKFTCPKCKKVVKQNVEIDTVNSRFSWSESPCNLCGSHGNLTYDPGVCPHCKCCFSDITLESF